jgi:hypothetical protein
MNDCPRQNPAYCRLRLFRPPAVAQIRARQRSAGPLSPFTDRKFRQI